MIPSNSVEVKRHTPWWASLLAAVLSYILLKYAAPELNPTHPVLQQLCAAAPSFAPIITIPFLLLAAKQLYDTGTNNQDDPAPDDDSPPSHPDS